MSDRRTITALIITAMAILNVVLALILSMFWRQYNNTEQAKIQADAAYTSIKSDYDLISSEFEKVKNRNLLQQQVQERLSKKLKFLEQEFHEDSTPSDSKIYQEMIVCDDVGLLRSFMMNADNSIATQAAWKLVQLTVPETPDNRRHKIDPNKLLEFSNFLEVRNRIRVPSWWRNELQTCKSISRDSIFACDLTDQLWKQQELRESNYQLPPVTKEGNRYVIHNQSDKCVLPRKYMINGRINAKRMSWFDDLCVFAMHSQTGHRHKVFAVEKQTGKIAWELGPAVEGEVVAHLDFTTPGLAWKQPRITGCLFSAIVLAVSMFTHLM